MLLAWTSIEAIQENKHPGVVVTYDVYYDFLVSTAEKMEENTKDTFHRKANVATTHMDPYSSDDVHYDKATE